MTEFRMPSLGADMEAGTLVQWLKQPGDVLARGDIIAVVDTDKGAIEIEVFEDGILDRVLVAVGQKVPVGTVLAMIRAADEAPGEVQSVPAVAAPRATPGARRAAAELRIDLADVTGTGPDGSITREDVDRAASRRRIGPPPFDSIPSRSARRDLAQGRPEAMRRAIAAAMSRAKREIPHLYLSLAIDVGHALAWLTAENERRPVEQRLLPIALLVKAAAKAAADVPDVNGFWIDGAFRPGAGVHVGCAIALRSGGLVVPAVHDADIRSLDEVMAAVMDVTARARAGGLRSSELSDATITVSNFGELGAESGYAIIYPPQVAIVAFGRSMVRPWVVGGSVVPRQVITVGLSADHRAVDGRRAAQYLAALERQLQNPEAL